jgi:broad specificity phosphatase PhoE
MTLYLVRHAQAGSRSTWTGENDELRPLTSEGRHQTANLVGMLELMPISRVFTSPYKRCIETAAPIAARFGCPLEIHHALAEGPFLEALSLARELIDEDVLFCSHGDIIPGLLDTFANVDDLDLGRQPRCQKASVWICEPDTDRQRFATATYLAPPR